MKKLPCILTIAGSDSGGGAGIQADLKAITVLGGYGLSVITALTAQNTRGVEGIHAPPAAFVAQQLKSVLTDIDVAAAKTGMLFSAAIMKAVAPFLRQASFPVVVDPVCVSQSGHKLLQDDAVNAMRELIFPHASLLTPNIPEAELFTGMSIKGPEDIARAAAKLLEMGPATVLIKGGHGMDSVASTDWFARPGHKPLPFMQPRVETNNNHGTGCTLSAAIATYLGMGQELPQAVREAQKYLNICLRDEISVGQGSGPPNHLAPQLKERERWPVLRELAEVAQALTDVEGLGRLLPRCGANVAYALPYPAGPADVASLSAPLCREAGGRILLVGHPAFEADPVLTSVLLSARKVRPDLHCCFSLRYEPGILEALATGGVGVASFDRKAAPATASRSWEAALEWGVFHAFSSHATAADVAIVADAGDQGVEGGTYLFASTAAELLSLLKKTLKMLK